MRRSSAYFVLVLLSGCYDFASLSNGDGKGVGGDDDLTAPPPPPDLSPPSDPPAAIDAVVRIDLAVSVDVGVVVTVDLAVPVDATVRVDAPTVVADATVAADATAPRDLALVVGSSCATGMGSGGACVPPPPQGWNGPGELYLGPPAAPPCGPSYASTPGYVGLNGLNAVAATCSCTCSDATGVSCANVALGIYASGNCPNTPCATVSVAMNSCVNLNVDVSACGTNNLAATASASTPQGGGCTPGAIAKGTNPPTWSQAVQACIPAVPLSQGTCAVGGLCAPLPDPSYHYCVGQFGDVPCPSGSAYSIRRIGYGNLSDTRGCSGCVCGGVTGAKCPGSLTIGSSCAGTINAVIPFGCNSFPSTAMTVALQGGAQGGTCLGTTSPTGGVVPTQPTTFCCLD